MSEEYIGTILEDIGKWHEARNLVDGSTDQAQFVKLTEELGEVAAAVARNKKEELVDGIGDMLVVLKNIAMRNDISLSYCALQAYKEIAPRKGRMVDGVFIKEEDLTS